MASCHRAMVERTKGRRPKNRPSDTRSGDPKNRPAKRGTLEATWVRGEGTREPWRRGATDFLQVVAATACPTVNFHLGFLVFLTSPLGYGGFTVQSSTACRQRPQRCYEFLHLVTSLYIRHRVHRGISFPACGQASLLFRASFVISIRWLSRNLFSSGSSVQTSNSDPVCSTSWHDLHPVSSALRGGCILEVEEEVYTGLRTMGDLSSVRRDLRVIKMATTEILHGIGLSCTSS